eukprot:TRINITY_DN10758_c0_g1_i1.p1 TRINITY_DN10758_c0_g1~~TRINITY_DN10758_c0_g1_i1.p1  ORF type:complete len:229 (-),score=44.02 TRINITY_DN10758_c0_g1_i1:41-727(-)
MEYLPGECVSSDGTLDLFGNGCTGLLVSKLLGFLIILGSLIVKVPQILKLTKLKSADGISMAMFQLELSGYLINACYSISLGYPFSTYGETVFLAIQNIIIMLLLYKYSTGVNLKAQLILGGYFVFTGVLLSGVVPSDVFSYLQASTIAIFSMSKLPQIYQSFVTKDASQLAIVTFLLNFVGSLARVFTTMKELDDIIVLSGFILGAVLNGILTLEIILWGGSKEKKE